jgi:hypothetical protein
MPSISPIGVREDLRAKFFQLLRSRHWSDDVRKAIEIEPSSIIKASEVVESLAAEPFKTYCAAREEVIRRVRGWDGIAPPQFEGLPAHHRRGTGGEYVELNDAAVAELDEQASAWAKRWSLATEWCMDRVYWTLEDWSKYPARLESLTWSGPSRALLLTDHIFKITEWDGSTPLSEYKKKAKKAASKQIDEHCRSLAKQADSLGVLTEPDRHGGMAFCWTVRVQILGEPAAAVAADVGVSPTTVEEAVKSILSRLDLPPRRRSTGRAKGSKDTKPRRKRKTSPKN